jgi:hypothetical protein
VPPSGATGAPGLIEGRPASAEANDAASPWVAIGIGLAATALAFGAPLLLGRRFGW